MKDIFHQSPNITPKKHNLYIHAQNTTNFGNKSLRAFDANIWSTLLEYIKSTKMEMHRIQIRLKHSLKHDTCVLAMANILQK